MAIAMVRKPHNLLGVGLYSIPEAARLLREPTPKVRRWIDGYTYCKDRSPHTSEAVVQRQLPALREADVLTFLDLIEMFFVKMFREHGVRMEVIRDAAAEAGKLFHTAHPFAVRRFDTDGKTIFATMNDEAPEERYIEELHKMQLVFEDQAKPFFKKLEYDLEEALRYWPLGKDRCVVLDPKRGFGKPIDAESGIPTHALYSVVKGGESPEVVASWYEVPIKIVRCAIEYEESLAK